MRHKIDKFFEQIADALGTNTTIACFTAIAVIPLFFEIPTTIIGWQTYISQTAIQLIALAVLQKGTRTEGRRQNKLIKEMHDLMVAEFKRECFSCKNHERVKP